MPRVAGIDLSTEGVEVVICISDSGPGIDSLDLPRLFDRFHRGAIARALEAPGFGLGLAISRAAIERQGGRIRAEGGPTGGATFRIRLPLAG